MMFAMRRLCSSRSMQTSASVLESLGISSSSPNSGLYNGRWGGSGEELSSVNPATGDVIGTTRGATLDEYNETLDTIAGARQAWMETPAPQRGEVVRRIGEELRRKRDDLGALVSMETGKILAEGIGEIQEAIDMCDYACGLSRMLSGSVLPSERPGHFMMERWLPLSGNVAIISAFNFPVAVFFWNACLSLVTGNSHLWKPADSVTLCAVASARIVADVMESMKFPGQIASFVSGPGDSIGRAIVADPRNALVSFTGSTRVGRIVGAEVAGRFGRSLLELGGNNAMVVMPDADVDLALSAALFSAVGTAGQRCTTLRRLFLHRSIYDQFSERLTKAYGQVKIGNQLQPGILCGPLHNKAAVDGFLNGISEIKKAGGKVLTGGKKWAGSSTGFFVEPTLVASVPHDAECVKKEVFAPILYLFPFDTLDDAIAMNNGVPQGLSSSLFTRDLSNMYKWTGPNGSDCGIVNCNVGTSGAEIGGAFGGEKETGGGRESGSDAWKGYCRRITATINYSDAMPLAQGIVFSTD